MTYKLIACDLDGTLLNDKSEVSAENLNAIKKITEKGVIFAIVTGRTLKEIPLELINCADIRYIIFSDGAAVLDKKSEEVIFTAYMNSDEIESIFGLLSSFDTMAEIFNDGTPFAEYSQLSSESLDYFEIDKSYRGVVESTRKGIKNMKNHLADFSKAEIFNVFFKNADERDLCIEKLNKIDGINVTTSMDNNLEIMSRSASKGNSLKKLCGEAGINMSEVIAAGDSKNDITMFRAAGLALSPANAAEEAKKNAEAVICSNNEHIAQYIYKHYFED